MITSYNCYLHSVYTLKYIIYHYYYPPLTLNVMDFCCIHIAIISKQDLDRES